MKSRGFTLPEALVSVVAFSLASLTLCMLTVYGMRAFRQSDQRVTTQRDLLRISQRLIRELAPCPISGATVLYPSGLPSLGDLALSLNTPRQENGVVQLDPISQTPIYSGYLLYYRDEASNELRRHYKPTSSTFPLAQASSDVQLDLSAGRGKTLLKNCVGFQLLSAMDGAPDASIKDPWIFCLRARSQQGQVLENRFLAYGH